MAGRGVGGRQAVGEARRRHHHARIQLGEECGKGEEDRCAGCGERKALASSSRERDRRDGGSRSQDDEDDSREDALVVLVDPDDERPDEEGGATERGRDGDPRRCSLGARSQVAGRAQAQIDGAVQCEEQHEREAGYDGVRREEIPEGAGELLARRDRDAVEEARERDAPDQRDSDGGDRVHPRPGIPPRSALRLAAPFEGDNARDQQDEQQEQRDVEAGEHRRVPDRERREGRSARDHEPHLVAVPERADRLDHRVPVVLAAAEDGQEHADAEVEAFGHEVQRPDDEEDPEPGGLHQKPGAASSAAPSAVSPSVSGGSSRA